MKTVIYRIVILVCVVAITMPASAQMPRAMMGSGNLLQHVYIRHVDRTVLGEDIIHYRFDVAVGRGKFDTIRLHRVVRERAPYQPIRTVDGIMLLPGQPNYFEAIFMSPLIFQGQAWDHSIVAFLAKHNIDVWGMDYAWALVPAETTDFSAFKGWGVVKDGQHAETALSLARVIRGFTGQDIGPLHVLGFSYGGIIAYAIAGEETQQPHVLRNIKGIIPLDVGLKVKEEAYRSVYCGSAATDQANLNAGVYSDDTGLFLKQLSDLAISSPNDSSPIIPGLTNLQAAMFFGTDTPLLTGLFWHFVGGYHDENGIPSDLRYTNTSLWVNLLGNIPPHYPMQTNFDVDATFCGTIPVPFDDHLRQIKIPILFAGAAGGMGTVGYYTPTLTSSKDVTKFVVQFLPDDQRAEDFGHADTTLARDAETLVWQPILDWLVAHQ
jgi:pimeloyl-ACP methyl ester carboxylesterase